MPVKTPTNDVIFAWSGDDSWTVMKADFKLPLFDCSSQTSTSMFYSAFS